MKIINQTKVELKLKDSNLSSLIIGFIVIIIGGTLGVAFFNHADSKVFLIVSGFLLLFGLLIILFSSAIIIDFKTINNQFNYTKKSFFRTKTDIYNFSDVSHVELRKQWQTEYTSYGNNSSSRIKVNNVTSKKVLLFQSILILKNGIELPLDNKKNSSDTTSLLDSSSVLMGGASKEVFIANQVATFLNVPFREVTPPNEEGAINLGSIN